MAVTSLYHVAASLAWQTHNPALIAEQREVLLALVRELTSRLCAPPGWMALSCLSRLSCFSAVSGSRDVDHVDAHDRVFSAANAAATQRLFPSKWVMVSAAGSTQSRQRALTATIAFPSELVPRTNELMPQVLQNR